MDFRLVCASPCRFGKGEGYRARDNRGTFFFPIGFNSRCVRKVQSLVSDWIDMGQLHLRMTIRQGMSGRKEGEMIQLYPYLAHCIATMIRQFRFRSFDSGRTLSNRSHTRGFHTRVRLFPIDETSDKNQGLIDTHLLLCSVFFLFREVTRRRRIIIDARKNTYLYIYRALPVSNKIRKCNFKGYVFF